MIKECREVDFARKEVKDDKLAEKLWKGSEALIERVEREDAVRRALEKKEKADAEKQHPSGKPAGKTGTALDGNDAQNPKSRRQRKTK